MISSSKNARKHFVCDYDDLHPEAQHEFEGLMWGWDDCKEEIINIINKMAKKAPNRNAVSEYPSGYLTALAELKAEMEKK